MNEIVEISKRTVQENAFSLFLLFLALLVTIIILLVDKFRKNARYAVWKKQTLNLGIYVREWERTDDKVLEQLFDENFRLENENKSLRGNYNKLTITLVFVLLWISIKNTLGKKSAG